LKLSLDTFVPEFIANAELKMKGASH